MNKKVATLNVPAIWTPIPVDTMNTRKYKSFPYEQDGVLKYASPENPVTRYAKNFKKGHLNFSICLFSDEQSMASVEKYMKDLTQKLTESQVSMCLVNSSASTFSYLESELYGGVK